MDDLWYTNLLGLMVGLRDRGIDPLKWVEDGKDLTVFDEQTGMQLLDEWVDERCDAFWSAGYLQALTNNTKYSSEEIVAMHLVEWSKNADSTDNTIP